MDVSIPVDETSYLSLSMKQISPTAVDFLRKTALSFTTRKVSKKNYGNNEQSYTKTIRNTICNVK